MIILQILGGIVLFTAILALTVYFYFKYKFGKLLDLNPSHNYSPLRVHLNEDLCPEWLEDKKIKKRISEIENLGFRVGKSFNIPEMDGVQLLSLIKEPSVAVLYNHKIVGNWVDFFAIGEDGHEYTVTNAPLGDGLIKRPDASKIFLKNVSIAEMTRKFWEQTDGRILTAIKKDDFRSAFEIAYAKDIQWKNRKGGISFQEFLSIEKDTPGNYSDKKIKQAFIDSKLQEIEQWHEAVIEQYIEQNNLDYFEEGNPVIVPDRFDTESYLQYLREQELIGDHINLDKLTEYFSGNSDIKSIFTTLNEKLSPELRAKKLASFNHPLPIDLYLVPES
ncbi:MAG: hypothetical protein V3V18_13175 [Methylococcales bacterium]